MSLTIISIFYNRAASVASSVSSLLAAAPSDATVVLVNDGSPDDTLKMLNSFKNDPRVVLVDQANSGFSPTLARLADHYCREGSAKYLAVFGAGDECAPEKFKIQLDYLEANPDVAAVGCGHVYVSASTGVTLATLSGEAEADWAFLTKDVPFTHGSIVYRTTAYLAAGGYDGRLKFCQDWDLYFRLVEHGRIVRHPAPLYKKILFEDGASASPRKRIEQMRYVALVRDRNSARPPVGAAGGGEQVGSAQVGGWGHLPIVLPKVDKRMLARCKADQIKMIMLGELDLARQWCDLILEVAPNSRSQRVLKPILAVARRLPFAAMSVAKLFYFARAVRRRVLRARPVAVGGSHKQS